MRRGLLVSCVCGLVLAGLCTPGAAQTIVVVDADGENGVYPSLAVINGQPAISYRGASSDGDLKYVRALDAWGRSWGTPRLVDICYFCGPTSLLEVNGRPAIGYRYSVYGGGAELLFVRALDEDGMSWPSPPVTVDDSGDTGSVSMALVNGRPAIAYSDGLTRDLMYVRAWDVDGSSWDTPVVVAAGDEGWYCSLAVVNGHPAISYHRSQGHGLKYVRALDADGGSWGTPVTIDDSPTTTGTGNSLAVVEGRPAISYYYFSYGNLMYVRALDPDGAAWPSPLMLDYEGRVGSSTSLAVIAGRPAISYYDYTNEDLKYIRARDSRGDSWQTPLVTDSFGVVGACSSLAEIMGGAGIAYCDGTNHDLKYACDIDGMIFYDHFESGDTSAWSYASP